MTAGHLITNGNLSFLCDVNAYRLIYTRRQLITVLTCKYLRIYYNTIFSMRNLQGSITNFTCFLTENSTKQSLLCCQLSLSLRSNLTNQNISCTNLCTNTDNTALIQIFQSIVTDTWYIACNLFRSEFCITGLCLIFLDMNRSVHVFLNKTLTQKNRILVVVAFPCHESNQRVLSKSKLTIRGRRTICNYLSGLYMLILHNDRLLVIAVTLVTSHEFCQTILIFCTVIIFNYNFF